MSRAERSAVQFLGTFHQPEPRAKLIVERFGIVAHHFKAAASCRAFGSKRANDHMAAHLDRARYVSYIGDTLLD